MRSVVALAGLVIAVSLAAVSATSANPTGDCRLLSDANAKRATDEDEVLKAEHSAGNGSVNCRFDMGPGEPASVPAEFRVRVQLDLQLLSFTKHAVKEIAASNCTYAHKGYYPEEACTFAQKAVKTDDPLRRFQFLHRSLQEMGSAEKAGGFGGPAFLAQLDPPLVGSELWVYLEEKKKVLVVTCIELRTAGKLPDNAHFPDCVFAAAHAALVKLL